LTGIEWDHLVSINLQGAQLESSNEHIQQLSQHQAQLRVALEAQDMDLQIARDKAERSTEITIRMLEIVKKEKRRQQKDKRREQRKCGFSTANEESHQPFLITSKQEVGILFAWL